MMSIKEKIIEFIKSEDFCEQFGHDFHVEDEFDDKNKIKCHHCGREETR